MKTLPQVAVIGGGIAGSVAALFLHRAGIPVRIYEAYPETNHVGSGFQIAPNGMQVLRALGLDEQVRARGASVSGLAFWNHRMRPLARARNGTRPEIGPAVPLLRSDFAEVLDGALRAAGIEVLRGRRLEALDDQPGARVQLSFTDGSSAEADLVIGADGVHSRTRALLFPERALATPLDILGIGGLASKEASAKIPASMRGAMHFLLGASGQFGLCEGPRDGRWMWWSHLPFPGQTREAVARVDVEKIRAEVYAKFEGWASPVPELLAGTAEPVVVGLYEVADLPRWSRGRTVLIADAAHAMTPSSGQGASLGMEDAMFLAHLLSQSPSIPESVFARYEGERRPRVERIGNEARANDKRQRGELGAVGMWLRDRMLGLFLPRLIERSFDQTYAYRIGA